MASFGSDNTQTRQIVFGAMDGEICLVPIVRVVVQSGRNATNAEAVDSKTLRLGWRFADFAVDADIRSAIVATDRDGLIAGIAEVPASDNSPSFSSLAK